LSVAWVFSTRIQTKTNGRHLSVQALHLNFAPENKSVVTTQTRRGNKENINGMVKAKAVIGIYH